MSRTLVIALCLVAAPARAHVGAKVSLAQFETPAALLSATDGGVGPSAIDVADASYVVSWYDGDMDPTGHYYFYYLDHQPPTGLSTDDVKNLATPIADVPFGIWTACDCVDGMGVMCPDAGVRDCRNQFTWDTHAIAPGAYWVIAIDNDPPYFLYSSSESPVRIGHGGSAPPGATIRKPNGIGSADQTYRLEWLADGDGPLHFDLAWGSDIYPGLNDPPTPIGTGVAVTDLGNNVYAFDWSTASLPTGDVYVQLKVTDAQGRSTVTDSRNLKIFHPVIGSDAAVDMAMRSPDLAMPVKKGGDGCDVAPPSDVAWPFGAAFSLALLLVLLARRQAR
jgi:hypothetical protein